MQIDTLKIPSEILPKEFFSKSGEKVVDKW